jgi:hypothetical protein
MKNWKLSTNENLSFSVYGKFPQGTKIWLAYLEGDSTSSSNRYSRGFLQKQNAIDYIIDNVMPMLLQNYLSQSHRELFIENFSKTPEEYFGCEFIKLPDKLKELLDKNGYFSYPNGDYYDDDDYFIIKELKLCSRVNCITEQDDQF